MRHFTSISDLAATADFVRQTDDYRQPFVVIDDVKETGWTESSAREYALEAITEQNDQLWHALGDAMMAGAAVDVTDDVRPDAEEFSADTGYSIGPETRYLRVIDEERTTAIVNETAGAEVAESMGVDSYNSLLNVIFTHDYPGLELPGFNQRRHDLAVVTHEGFHSRSGPKKAVIAIGKDSEPELLITAVGTTDLPFGHKEDYWLNLLEETFATITTERHVARKLDLPDNGPYDLVFGAYDRTKQKYVAATLEIPSELIISQGTRDEPVLFVTCDDYTIGAAAIDKLMAASPVAADAIKVYVSDSSDENKAILRTVINGIDDHLWDYLSSPVSSARQFAYELAAVLE